MECKTCNKYVRFENGYEVKWMFDAPVGMCTLFFCNSTCWKQHHAILQRKVDDNKYKSDSVSYLYEFNFEEFNEQFKDRYNREASKEDWELFVVKFNELRTEHISSGIYDGIHEILEQYYVEGFVCEGCKETKEPDGLEVSCTQCSKNHGCSECNGSWTVRSRHFCDDCDTGYGYDMFCCNQCGYEGEENDDTTYAMDGTFCNDKCLQHYCEENKEEAEETEKKVNLTIGA